MLIINDWQGLSQEEKQQKLRRPKQANTFKAQVQDIIAAVKENGDEALFAFSREFDSVDLTELRVPLDSILSAEISNEASCALKKAIQTIKSYHQAMMPSSKQFVSAKGIAIDRIYRPIARVGLYVPGGSNTPLVSSLLMLAIPALLAL